MFEDILNNTTRLEVDKPVEDAVSVKDMSKSEQVTPGDLGQMDAMSKPKHAGADYYDESDNGFDEFVDRLKGGSSLRDAFDYAVDEGYDRGHDEGYEKGYDEGYSTGYDDGANEGGY